MSDKKDFPPRWAFPDLTEAEYQNLIDNKLKTMYQLDQKIIRETKRGGCFKQFFVFWFAVNSLISLVVLTLWLFGFDVNR